MFAQIGGAVNNDNLLILLGSLELYLLVRILRRGLTLLSGLAVGVVLGLGIMAKPNMYAFAPVVAFALGWILVRERQRWRAIAKPIALAVAAAAFVTLGSYAAFHQSELVAGSTSATGGSGGSLRALLSYLWQWYLPALPFMRDFWPPAGDISVPAWDIYFRGFWADFAHLDTVFPRWVYVVMGIVSLCAVPAIVMAVIRERERRSVLIGQVLVLASAVAATALLVTYRSYLALIQSNVQPFAQGRYLLQTVVVVGAAVALAARGPGQRWGPVAAAALITALFGFNVFSLGLVLTRFYT
jgi:4-amino-4-deoxy-L-arabinose transferase-like glycosyltransferase